MILLLNYIGLSLNNHFIFKLSFLLVGFKGTLKLGTILLQGLTHSRGVFGFWANNSFLQLRISVYSRSQVGLDGL